MKNVEKNKNCTSETNSRYDKYLKIIIDIIGIIVITYVAPFRRQSDTSKNINNNNRSNKTTTQFKIYNKQHKIIQDSILI